jgi:plastocyanin
MQGTVTAEGEAVAAAPASDSQTATTAEDTTAQPQEAAEAGEATVSIVDFAFEPATLDVSAGTTVVWTNTGQAPHTVTGDFADSGVLEPGQTFSHTFAQSGDFSYVCAIHPQMTGAIRVGVAAAPASTLTATPAADGTTVEGVWLIQLTPDNEEILRRHQALATFHADGTVEADFSAVSGAGAATSVLTAGRGEWLLQEQGQGTVCRVSLIALMNDADRRFAGTAKVEAEARLDATGRAIDGAFEYAVVSAGGQSLGDGSGTLSGESVPLDP